MAEELKEILADLKSDREIALEEINSVEVQMDAVDETGNNRYVHFDRDRADYKQKLLGFLNKNSETRLKALDKAQEKLPDDSEEEEDENETANIFSIIKAQREETRRSG